MIRSKNKFKKIHYWYRLSTGRFFTQSCPTLMNVVLRLSSVLQSLAGIHQVFAAISLTVNFNLKLPMLSFNLFLVAVLLMQYPNLLLVALLALNDCDLLLAAVLVMYDLPLFLVALLICAGEIENLGVVLVATVSLLPSLNSFFKVHGWRHNWGDNWRISDKFVSSTRLPGRRIHSSLAAVGRSLKTIQSTESRYCYHTWT